VTRTYYDMEIDPDDVWRALRKSRQSPPGAASERYEGNIDPKSGSCTLEGAARVGTYRAALEQAEQLMKAAAATGPAAQPLPLFYALSQFGRAMAAAAPALATSTGEFRLKGHGVRATNLDGVDRRGVATVKVHGEKTGAFPSVAKALSASPMHDERTIGQLLGWIPGSARFELDNVEAPQPTVLELRAMYPPANTIQLVTVVGVPQDLVAGDTYAEAGVTLPRQLGPDDPLLSAFFGRYPALRDLAAGRPNDPDQGGPGQ
jgi:hypothetical protein